MRKTFVAACILATAGTALGAEFQPMGALGIGGAGVARTYDAYAPYWNPAGLGFNKNSFSSRIDASVGLKISDGLADNVDRLSDLDFDNFDTINTAQTDPTTVTDTIKAITILEDIKAKNGTLSVNGNAVIAFQAGRFGFGAFGTFEGFAQPLPDTVNILPESNDSGAVVNVADFANQVAGSAPSSVFFSPIERTEILNALQTTGGFNPQQATDIVNATDAGLAGSGMASQEVTRTLVSSIAPAFADGTTRILDNNTTAVLTRSLAYLEFPLSYGYPLSIGSYGTLSLGATGKVIAGRVYQSQTFLLKQGENVESSDIVSDMTKNYKDTVNFGIDLGALWRYKEWLNVGLVAKNLNSPSFDAPEIKDKSGEFIPGSGGKVKLKPQVRAGVAIDPVSWLTLAADIDLTENETVVAADNFKSRHLGGGFEWHSFSWFKLRGGMYTNLAESSASPTATAGFTLGTKWINIEIDGAYGLDTAEYDGEKYPQEARVQFN